MNKGFEAIEAHHLFGVPYERIDGRRPPAVDRPLADRPQRRLLARPPRPSRHAGADLLRAALPRARRRRRAAPRPRRGRRADLRGARPGDLRLPAAGAARPARRGAPRPACSTPPTRSPSPPSSTAGSASPRSPRRSSACWSEMPARAADPLRGPLRRRRRGPPPHRRAGRGVDDTHELGLDLPRLLAADHPPRGRALLRRQGDRDAGRALLPLLRPEALVGQTRRDRVRDRSDPARAAT